MLQANKAQQNMCDTFFLLLPLCPILLLLLASHYYFAFYVAQE